MINYDPIPTPLEMKHLRKQIYRHLQWDMRNMLKCIDINVPVCNSKVIADVYLETIYGLKIAVETNWKQFSIYELRQRAKAFADHDIFTFWVAPFRCSQFTDDNGSIKSIVKLDDHDLFALYANNGKFVTYILADCDQFDFMVFVLGDHPIFRNRKLVLHGSSAILSQDSVAKFLFEEQIDDKLIVPDRNLIYFDKVNKDEVDRYVNETNEDWKWN